MMNESDMEVWIGGIKWVQRLESETMNIRISLNTIRSLIGSQCRWWRIEVMYSYHGDWDTSVLDALQFIQLQSGRPYRRLLYECNRHVTKTWSNLWVVVSSRNCWYLTNVVYGCHSCMAIFFLSSGKLGGREVKTSGKLESSIIDYVLLSLYVHSMCGMTHTKKQPGVKCFQQTLWDSFTVFLWKFL